MPEAPEIFARIYARHGHRCPMSTLGGRLALAAIRALDGRPDDLRAVYGNRTCALDGIAEVAGCSEENGRLVVKSAGCHALTLRVPGTEVTVELTAAALEIAGRYRALCNRLESGWEALGEAEKLRRRAEMDALLDDLLPQLWQAEDDFLVQRVTA